MAREREPSDIDLALRDLQYAIGQAVHDRRESLGWSQEELAQRAGTRQPHVSRLEGAGNLPRLDLLLRVAHAMGTDLVVRFEPTEQRADQPAAPSEAPSKGLVP